MSCKDLVLSCKDLVLSCKDLVLSYKDLVLCLVEDYILIRSGLLWKDILIQIREKGI